MVAFVSLFLWLMTGVHEVQVSVEPRVASVDIVLDGRRVGVATAPRWSVDCDFGETPRPHELIAVAYDENGAETGRARQLVNLPRADAEVEIVLEGADPNAPELLRVITESSERLAPLAVFVTFDGRSLQDRGDGRFPLPDHDRALGHIISAEVHFEGGAIARTDATFGGMFGSRVATELTAVPVVAERRRRLDSDQLQGLVRARGEVVRVVAVERPGAHLYLVRDIRAWPAALAVGRSLDRRISANRTVRKRWGETARTVVNEKALTPGQSRFFLVVPNPTRSRGVALFPVIGPFEIKRGWLPWLATHLWSSQAEESGQRISEAVAVAGVRAAAGGAPRAVVLVVTADADTVGDPHYQPQAVREYLRALHVPLVVWSTEGDRRASAWGEATAAVSDRASLKNASKRLLKELERQWIVWVEGSHLPSDIELDDGAVGLRVAD